MRDLPAEPVTCPETGDPCVHGCDLGQLGRAYCIRWVGRIRAEAIAAMAEPD